MIVDRDLLDGAGEQRWSQLSILAKPGADSGADVGIFFGANDQFFGEMSAKALSRGPWRRCTRQPASHYPCESSRSGTETQSSAAHSFASGSLLLTGNGACSDDHAGTKRGRDRRRSAVGGGLLAWSPVSDYDAIGGGYAQVRHPDPRIADQIRRALGDAWSVVNVGAGTGSYEPTDMEVAAVEPSERMIAQRPAGSVTAVQASAEQLPFPDDAFDAALAILSVHHWSDWRAGISEMKRVARRRIVIMTWDPVAAAHFWLHEYLPEMAEVDAARFVPFDVFRAEMGKAQVAPLLIPHDCTDGFLAAYWRRPEAYLDAHVRAGISSFSLDVETAAGLARLAADLRDGRWAKRWGHLLDVDALDLGYRLIVAEVA